jgi:putative DNA primase/helicase
MELPPSILYHPNLEYYDFDESGKSIFIGKFPAMIAIFSDINNKPVTLHRTYLTDEGKKAPVSSVKKMMTPVISGSLKGCSIKLASPSNVLYITEGIETGLSIMLALNVPVWVAGTAGLMEKILIPEWVNEVFIMADLDRSGQGERSANILAERLRNQLIKVAILLPEVELLTNQKSIDWLDIFNMENK